MATATEPRLVTTNEFLKLVESTADDDVTLELINGELQERRMTTRSPRHSIAMAKVSHFLANWLEEQATRQGVIAVGEARCRLQTNPDTIVGLDVAYFEGTPVVETEAGSQFFDGPPILAVEVLSPTDTHRGVSGRIRQLPEAGVAQVWKVDPDFRTVTVHRAHAEPRFYNSTMHLTGEPELPGFACEVSRLFGDMSARPAHVSES